MPPRSLANQRVVITGASSGVGRALAERLAAEEARLLLVARRSEALDELASEIAGRGCERPAVVAGDVTQPEARAAIVAEAGRLWGAVDVLVNNAGVSAHGRFATSTPETLRQIMEVNFFAAAELTRESLTLLQEGERALVVNVGSALGHRGVPHNSEYCASKFALRGWSESIRSELKPLGIGVLMVSPGTIDTEFFDHLVSRQGATPWPEQKGVPAAAVAEQVVAAISRGRAEVFPNWRGRSLVMLNRVAPRLVDRVMNRYG